MFLNENDCVHRIDNNDTAKYSVQNPACKATLNNLHTNYVQTAIGLDLYVTGNNGYMVYYAFFHSIMNYGLIFWGNSSNIEKFLKHKST